ncbi:hypothetical protein [Nocardia sp. NPDC050175]|uniref:hypothetical protein n=1 Tax=Nocardia sp. NPDC050175 TaxID=3364317 RepID=UPI0037B37391
MVETVLDFYLAIGCEVHRAADGWVVLRIGAMQFVVADAGTNSGQSVSSSVVLLWTSDLAELILHLHDAGARIASCAEAGGSVFAVGPGGCTLVITECDTEVATPPANGVWTPR